MIVLHQWGLAIVLFPAAVLTLSLSPYQYPGSALDPQYVFLFVLPADALASLDFYAVSLRPPLVARNRRASSA
jgi:hypothetical protein